MDYNTLFTPATKHTGKFKGLYIVCKEVQKIYYASNSGQSETTKYRLHKVAKKQGDLLISDKHYRIRLHDAYILNDTSAADKWPTWDDTTDNRPLDKIELLHLLDLAI
jgi:hypothetical protein